MTAPAPRCQPSSETLADYFNPARLKIAAYLLARDEEDLCKPVSKYLIDWETQVVKVGMTAEHRGDCTNEPFSCHRCIADHALAHADAIIALQSEKTP